MELSPKINCFIGQNGVGKTNVLDAVYYMSFCRSSNNPIDAQVIRHGEDFCVIEGNYLGDNGEEENIYVGMKRGVKKHFKRNKKDYKRLSEHIGLIPLVMISPNDGGIIQGAGEERRRMMDIVISQYDYQYMVDLGRYNKALQQRNSMLKAETEPDYLLLSICEEQMAVAGEAVYRKRKDFVEGIIPVFQKYYADISEDREMVSLRYVSHCQRGPLIDVIQRDRMKDIAVGYSLHGIHRDDLEMMLGDYMMKREGSQGQNKTYVVALRLALFDFLKQHGNKTTPILLLDDIFDKLDARRVERIVKLVASDEFGQIFITDTNRENLDKILAQSSMDYKIFYVDNGEITEKRE